MFWNTIGLEYLVEEGQLEKKLADPDVTLKEVLEDPHCFQEIRNSNKTLLDYLKREVVLKELFEIILCPVAAQEEESFQRSEYKYVHLCCETICLASKELFEEFSNNQELVDKFTNFLQYQSGNLNHLLVSFYSKIVVSMLTADPEKSLPIFESSTLLENCFGALEFCAIFELFCTMSNCLPDPVYRDRVKKWYHNKGFIDHLLHLLSPDQPSEIHENAAAIWTEFVKALREHQYADEPMREDLLLESIQSEEAVRRLLQMMFLADTSTYGYSTSVIANGASVLNALLSTNYVKNSPSWLLAHEQQQDDSSSFTHPNNKYDSAESSQTVEISMDPHRVVETLCAEESASIARVALDYFQRGGVVELYGDAMVSCMQLLVNLTDTNFLPTHLELLNTFRTDGIHLKEFFTSLNKRPACSIYNRLLNNFISNILYSATGGERPLIAYLFGKEFDIIGLLCHALKYLCEIDAAYRIECYSRRSFYYSLTNRVIRSARDGTPQGAYISSLIKENARYEEWQELCHTQVAQYNRLHHPGNSTFAANSTASTTLRSHNNSGGGGGGSALEVDELQQLAFGAATEPFIDDDFTGATTISPSAVAAAASLGRDAVFDMDEDVVVQPNENGERQGEVPSVSFLTGTGTGSSGSPTLQLFEMLERIEVKQQQQPPPPQDSNST